MADDFAVCVDVAQISGNTCVALASDPERPNQVTYLERRGHRREPARSRGG